jgi:type II secretory pathway pseudopilin PulG
MSIRYMLVVAVIAALLVPMSALSANPTQPNRFELTATSVDIHGCIRVGEVVNYAVRVTNTSNHDVVAVVSPSNIGRDQYTFQYVSSKPTIGSNTVSLTDPSGAPYSYTTWQWQRRIRAGKTMIFNVAVRVPDWNFPSPPYTDPSTGQIYYPPPAQPYPQSLIFDIGALGSTGGTVAGAKSAYCG